MNISLKKKITILGFGITVLLGGISAFLVSRLVKSQYETALTAQMTKVKNLKSAIAAQFFERYGDVQAFAINPGLQSNNRVEVVRILNHYANLYGIYDLIMVVGTDGKLIAVNNKNPQGDFIDVNPLYDENFSNEIWFQKTLVGDFSRDPQNGFDGTFVEEPQFDRYIEKVYKRQTWANSFSAPIKNAQGKVVAVITNRSNFKWLTNEFKNQYADLKAAGFESSILTLINHKGFILAELDGSQNNEDLSILGKFNLVDSGNVAAQSLVQGRSGVDVLMNTRKKVDQVTAYSTLQGPKWLSSLNWSLMIRTNASEYFALAKRLERSFYFSFAVVMILALVFSTLLSNRISNSLLKVNSKLTDETRKVLQSSQQIAETSSNLSSAATEQAAALQETVSAIDEVSAMIQKNAENAKRSREKAEQCNETAQSGKESVQQVIYSIKDIEKSNSEIGDQVRHINDEFGKIIKVINEIGSKTKIINDIVFQTKLLSFNASVEAARAGEHGKGFAVVAEEVSNLAQMSGNAAKEISLLLEESVKKVEAIVAETQSKLDRLLEQGSKTVEKGIQTASRCGSVLDEIVQSVGELSMMVDEIATASHEQSQGVIEITKAMNQLDQVTHSNSNAAQSLAANSEGIHAQSIAFNELVMELSQLITGEDNKLAAETAQLSILKKNSESMIRASAGESARIPQSFGPKTVVSLSEAMKKRSPRVPSAEDPRFDEAV